MIISGFQTFTDNFYGASPLMFLINALSCFLKTQSYSYFFSRLDVVNEDHLEVKI